MLWRYRNERWEYEKLCTMDDPEKRAVYEFWNAASCGENLYLNGNSADSYKKHAEIRYSLEPEILSFAEFARWKDRKVLEVGVGLGADHACFAAAGAKLFGIDLTERAVNHTKCRLQAIGCKSILHVGDAEQLPFQSDSFDLVYSWGVLHHSPDTARCVHEIYRVLKTNGLAKIMMYHKFSMVGYMLWLRYGLFCARPFTSLTDIYARYLESPGTKAFSATEVRVFFEKFRDIRIQVMLSHGDILTSQAGQRHRGIMLTVARKIWPRWFIRRFLKNHGLAMLITATK